ncbi:MAG TPA: LytTR family DNA-binding domain-containing protein [Saprospiraceae bacterium]|nr:response regulator transcription factor [Lewinellaceae bacterium]HPK08796.1 LytTR family DNA-binding domain-containing protein [Saprospiraceae bacterium]
MLRQIKISYRSEIFSIGNYLITSGFGKFVPPKELVVYSLSTCVMLLRALLLEDEKNSAELLFTLINEFCPELKIVKICNSKEELINNISIHKPEVLFLDVNINGEKSIEWIDDFKNENIAIIFTTGSPEFAYDAFQLNAVHYILKPYTVTEVRKAVDKLIEYYVQFEKERKPLIINTNEGTYKFPIDEILYLKAERSYCNIRLINDKWILVGKPLNEIFNMLGESLFFRAHKSYAVNVKFIKRLAKNEQPYIELTDGELIPLARRRREEFLEKYFKSKT